MKYQLISNPSVIVDAVQFDPQKQPWPDGLIPHPKDAKPKDMTWGYIDTVSGQVHVMASDYIVEGYLGGRRVLHRKDFEETFCHVMVIGEQKQTKLGRIRKYRAEKEMHQALSNACHGKFTMCIPTNISDDDMVLSDVISELIERRKENPKRDELKEVLDQLLQQDRDRMAHSLANYRLTCDGALNAIRHEARI